MKLMLMSCLLAIAFSATSQTTTFRTAHWGDTKKTHDWTIALDNPVAEPVVIVESPTTFKVTLGKKVKLYKIVSSSKMDDDTTLFNTLSEGKPYIIKVMFLSTDKTYAVFCENEWAVDNIKDVATAK